MARPGATPTSAATALAQAGSDTSITIGPWTIEGPLWLIIVGGVLAIGVAAILAWVLGRVAYFHALALRSRVPIQTAEIVGMGLRKVAVGAVIRARGAAIKEGIDVSLNTLETHALADGDVEKLVQSIVAARKAGFDMPWQVAASIDLAGVAYEQVIARALRRTKRDPASPRVVTGEDIFETDQPRRRT